MFSAHVAQVLLWTISAISILLMLARPFGITEAIWVCGGAILLLLLRLTSLHAAAHAALQGTDVYLFLTGMMLLSELARSNGVFDWFAGLALRLAKGSPARLFALLYAVGTLVTVFMSNDATAVVLTPAVLAATRKAKVKPLPYLFACALIANAASFVLPISNPANLVLFNKGMPPLSRWLAMFALPSMVSIAVTYLALHAIFRADLSSSGADDVEQVRLSAPGRIAFFGILGISAVLLLASALNWNLGLPTFLCALLIAVAVLYRARKTPLSILREISWSVLPLVAGLFIIAEAIRQTGAFHMLTAALNQAARLPAWLGTLATGGAVGLGSNLVNNLPVGVIAASTLKAAHPPLLLTRASLIGVDLGPNLSVTGSLATILWLMALKRGQVQISGWQFLKIGLLAMPAALLLTLLASLLA